MGKLTQEIFAFEANLAYIVRICLKKYFSFEFRYRKKWIFFYLLEKSKNWRNYVYIHLRALELYQDSENLQDLKSRKRAKSNQMIQAFDFHDSSQGFLPFQK
jgi:hypothetical protein